MPQLSLEYTSNVLEHDNFSELFKQCHTILTEQLPTDLAACKSRVVKCADYYIGNGDANNAFVSLHVKVMAGRSAETLTTISNAMMQVLQQHFAQSLAQRNLQITLQMQELAPSLYFKITS